MVYSREIQAGDYMCVFASVVGAVNSVVGKQVWTQDSLLTAWRANGFKEHELNFGNVAPVAVEPVKNGVRFQQHVDGPTPVGDAAYLKLIQDCIDRGGVAIVSCELADPATLVRQGNWHMVSLFARTGNVFDAWDTGGRDIQVTDAEITSKFRSGPSMLLVHDKHDMLLIEPT
jgi:hypothetical protein